MVNIHIILGMNWYSPYHDFLDFNAKSLTLVMLCVLRVEFRDTSVEPPPMDFIPMV